MIRCRECKFLKIYDYLHTNYYCDHENRTDDMGKLTFDHLDKESPKWCPMKGRCTL